MKNTINDILLSQHFLLEEFVNSKKYPDNKPSLQHVVNMTYGCLMLLEPAPAGCTSPGLPSEHLAMMSGLGTTSKYLR